MSTYLVKHFLKYNMIFQENSKGESAFLLQEGRVEISKEIDNKKKVLTVLTPVALFGEMAILLDDNRRTATAVALEDCKVVEIKKDDFEEFVKQSPQIMQTVLSVLVSRLKVATEKSMRVPSPFQGICQLMDLFVRHGVYDLDFLHTVKTFAQSFIIAPSKVNALLNSLAGLGMVEMWKHKDGSKRIRLLVQEEFAANAVKRVRVKATGGGGGLPE